jgi:hypothetical protein
MSNHIERDSYDIEKQIYKTQWDNIRHHWDKTFAGVTYLSTLIALAVVPLKFLRVSEGGIVQLGVDTMVNCYVKMFVAAVILLLGVVTFLNQYNHFMRSSAARKVIVAIEKKWGLYDKEGNFIFQDKDTKYAYSKFAGGEKRLTYSQVQFAYIIVITVAALVFVVFA